MALSPVNLVMMVYCARSLRVYNVQDYLPMCPTLKPVRPETSTLRLKLDEDAEVTVLHAHIKHPIWALTDNHSGYNLRERNWKTQFKHIWVSQRRRWRMLDIKLKNRLERSFPLYTTWLKLSLFCHVMPCYDPMNDDLTVLLLNNHQPLRTSQTLLQRLQSWPMARVLPLRKEDTTSPQYPDSSRSLCCQGNQHSLRASFAL